MRGIIPAALAALVMLGAVARAGEPVVYREVGKASIYASDLAGQRTASGARYDPEALTAAHPSLPLGSEVTVVALDTGRQVEVLLSSALEACEAYYQAFQFVVWSGMDAQSAVGAVMFETVGEA